MPVCHSANPTDKLFEIVNLCAEKLFKDLRKKRFTPKKQTTFALLKRGQAALNLPASTVANHWNNQRGV
jgi:hypothetical protein